MKTVTLTVEIKATLNDGVNPNEVTFRGIELAVPQVAGQDVGSVESYCTQEYFGEDPQ